MDTVWLDLLLIRIILLVHRCDGVEPPSNCTVPCLVTEVVNYTYAECAGVYTYDASACPNFDFPTWVKPHPDVGRIRYLSKMGNSDTWSVRQTCSVGSYAEAKVDMFYPWLKPWAGNCQVVCSLPAADINECVSCPCLNGGDCVDQLSAYTCSCSGTGFTGINCETEFDECVSDPCLNGGRCLDQFNGYICFCLGTGFEGNHCETEISDHVHIKVVQMDGLKSNHFGFGLADKQPTMTLTEAVNSTITHVEERASLVKCAALCGQHTSCCDVITECLSAESSCCAFYYNVIDLKCILLDGIMPLKHQYREDEWQFFSFSMK